jgi:hypothetical protein
MKSRGVWLFIYRVGVLTGRGTHRMKAGYKSEWIGAGVDVVKLFQLGQGIMRVPTASALLECV